MTAPDGNIVAGGSFDFRGTQVPGSASLIRSGGAMRWPHVALCRGQGPTYGLCDGALAYADRVVEGDPLGTRFMESLWEHAHELDELADGLIFAEVPDERPLWRAMVVALAGGQLSLLEWQLESFLEEREHDWSDHDLALLVALLVTGGDRYDAAYAMNGEVRIAAGPERGPDQLTIEPHVHVEGVLVDFLLTSDWPEGPPGENVSHRAVLHEPPRVGGQEAENRESVLTSLYGRHSVVTYTDEEIEKDVFALAARILD